MSTFWKMKGLTVAACSYDYTVCFFSFKTDIVSSLLLSMLKQMFTEDRNDTVRATVIKGLALVMTIVESPSKYKEVWIWMRWNVIRKSLIVDQKWWKSTSFAGCCSSSQMHFTSTFITTAVNHRIRSTDFAKGRWQEPAQRTLRAYFTYCILYGKLYEQLSVICLVRLKCRQIVVQVGLPTTFLGISTSV